MNSPLLWQGSKLLSSYPWFTLTRLSYINAYTDMNCFRTYLSKSNALTFSDAWQSAMPVTLPALMVTLKAIVTLGGWPSDG